MDRMQVNVLLDADLAARLDEKRIALQKQTGRIPSRSEIMRLALELYLKRKDSKRVKG